MRETGYDEKARDGITLANCILIFFSKKGKPCICRRAFVAMLFSENTTHACAAKANTHAHTQRLGHKVITCPCTHNAIQIAALRQGATPGDDGNPSPAAPPPLSLGEPPHHPGGRTQQNLLGRPQLSPVRLACMPSTSLSCPAPSEEKPRNFFFSTPYVTYYEYSSLLNARPALRSFCSRGTQCARAEVPSRTSTHTDTRFARSTYYIWVSFPGRAVTFLWR